MKRRVGESAVGYPEQPTTSYAMTDVDQLQAMRHPDVVPTSGDELSHFSRGLAADAVLYGMPAVLQYVHMYEQAVQSASPAYTGFNTFRHDRELAGPGYRAFLTPNADTLYSNAWLDLTAGPVAIEVPAFGARYYTLNFLDMYSNATNISTLTAGGDGGRYWVAPAGWHGCAPASATVFRVATEYMWILLRIFIDGDADLLAGRRLQNAVRITASGGASVAAGPFPAATAETVRTDWLSYFSVLDFVLRHVAHPEQEDALVYRYRTLGLGGPHAWSATALPQSMREGMARGFADALRFVHSVRASLGVPIGATGWSRGHPGAYGFNYLRRAATNYVGLGATVREENQAFVAWRADDGTFLDGATGDYTLRIDPAPPVDAFWSLSAYDANTQQLHPNPVDRFVISDRTRGVRRAGDGSLTVDLRHRPPADTANWLPVPAGPFYLVIRAYGPRPELLSGDWTPRPVERVRIGGGDLR